MLAFLKGDEKEEKIKVIPTFVPFKKIIKDLTDA